MSCLVVVSFNVLDESKLKQYSAAAAPTLITYGGEFVAKGKSTKLDGETNFTMIAVIAFVNKEVANNWYTSTEYQKIIPLRNEAMESHFQIIGESQT